MIQETCDSPGVLTRELYVRVVDVSASGCLIESRRRLGVGAVGRLKLKFGSAEYADDVEVVGCRAVCLSHRCAFPVDIAAPSGLVRHAVAPRHNSTVHCLRCDVDSRGAGAGETFLSGAPGLR